jgi:hypothetical protein
MLDKIKQIVDTSTWFLRTGVAPVNSSNLENQKLKSVNHMTSRKFAMTLIAVFIVAFMYFASVIILFLFPSDPHVSALVSMYKDMIVAIAAIAGTLVGIQGLVDWKYKSSSQVEVGSYNEEYLASPKEEDYSLEIKNPRNKKLK